MFFWCVFLVGIESFNDFWCFNVSFLRILSGVVRWFGCLRIKHELSFVVILQGSQCFRVQKGDPERINFIKCKKCSVKCTNILESMEVENPKP